MPAHSQVDHNALAEAECVGHSKRDYDHVVFIVIVVKEGSEILHLSHRLGDERMVCLAAALEYARSTAGVLQYCNILG